MTIKHFLLSLSLSAVALAIYASSARAQSPAIGAKAPEFSLTDVSGKEVSLKDYAGKIVVLEWFNPECPFVKKHYNPGNMQNAQKHVVDGGGVWLTISSSAEGKQGYLTAESGKQVAAALKMNSTAVLLDHTGSVGKSFGARTTPHIFVVAGNGTMAYAGAIDDRPSAKESDVPGARNYALAAFDALSAGKPVGVSITEPYGCGVKYAAK